MSGKPPAMALPWGWGGAAVAPPVSSVMNMSRPFLNQWPRLEDTPSLGNLSKETLDFFIIEPAILNVLSETCFHVLKAYFLSVKSKIHFQIFTVLPLGLFWS